MRELRQNRSLRSEFLLPSTLLQTSRRRDASVVERRPLVSKLETPTNSASEGIIDLPSSARLTSLVNYSLRQAAS